MREQFSIIKCITFLSIPLSVRLVGGHGSGKRKKQKRLHCFLETSVRNHPWIVRLPMHPPTHTNTEKSPKKLLGQRRRIEIRRGYPCSSLCVVCASACVLRTQSSVPGRVRASVVMQDRFSVQQSLLPRAFHESSPLVPPVSQLLLSHSYFGVFKQIERYHNPHDELIKVVELDSDVIKAGSKIYIIDMKVVPKLSLACNE